MDVKSEEFQKTVVDIDPQFTRFLENYQADRNYEDLLLIIGDEIGLIMYTGKKLSDLGTSLKSGPLKESSLARLWQKVIETGKVAMVDYSKYAPSDTVSAFLGVPVLREDGKMYGVLVLRLGAENLGESLRAVRQMGPHGRCLCCGKRPSPAFRFGRLGERHSCTKGGKPSCA